MIYLDNAATSWPKPESVYQKTEEALRAGGSPGRGGYQKARKAAEVLYEAREALAELIRAPIATQIAFAQNATDALSMALFGLIKPGDIVVTTSMEHNAVARPLWQLQQTGVIIRKVSCNAQGELNWNMLKEALSGAQWIVLTHASNVSGTVFPIHEIGRLAAERNVRCIVDACQTIGVKEIDVQAGLFSAVAFSGHKGLLSPQGVGALYIEENLSCKPLRYGGTGSLSESEEQPSFMPDRLESGTPNVPGIAGLLAGVEYIAAKGQDAICRHELKLAQLLWEGLGVLPKVKRLGPGFAAERTAVVSFAVEGIDSGMISRALEETAAIASRSGLHCAPWAHKTLGSLESGAVRFSPGIYNNEAEVKIVLETLEAVLKTESAW